MLFSENIFSLRGVRTVSFLLFLLVIFFLAFVYVRAENEAATVEVNDGVIASSTVDYAVITSTASHDSPSSSSTAESSGAEAENHNNSSVENSQGEENIAVPIVITEIAAYEPSGHEWVEIYNRSNEPVDVFGWVFWEGGVNHSLLVAQGEDYVLHPRAFAIIAVNANNFLADYQGVTSTVFDSSWSTLNESGEEIGIKDLLGNEQEIFTYVTAGEASLERINYELDEYGTSNWKERENGNSAGVDNYAYTAAQSIGIGTQTGSSTSSTSVDVSTTTEAASDSGGESESGEAVSHTSSSSDGGTTDTSSAAAQASSTDHSSSAQEDDKQAATTTQNQSNEEEINLPQYKYGDVVISEFVSSPDTGQVEFVELQNQLSESVNLDSWCIKDGSGAKTYISGTLASGGLYVIEKPKGSLNNSGDEIHVFDSYGTNIFSLIYGTDEIAAPKKGESVARNHQGEYVVTMFITQGEENEFSVEEYTNDAGGVVESGKTSNSSKSKSITGSATAKTESNTTAQTGTENSATTTSAQSGVEARVNLVSSYVYISEIMPNPTGADSAEFVELFNSASSTIDISGFILDDKDGGSRGYIIPSLTFIAPFGFKTFLRTETGIALNNSDDEVRLLAPRDAQQQSNVIQTVAYADTVEGYSYAYVSGTWYWASQSTPGNENMLDALAGDNGEIGGGGGSSDGLLPEDSEVEANSESTEAEVGFVPIGDVRELELGSPVLVRGVVSVLPGVFGSQYFYIHQIAETGVQVYMYKKDFPALKIGDVVEISGEVTESKGERRIKVSGRDDIQIIASAKHVEPRDMGIFDAADVGVGALVRLTGEITSLKRNTMYIDDGTDEILVYIKTGTKIDTKLYKEGEVVAVSGLLVPSKTGLQLLPRSQEDIQKSDQMDGDVSDGTNAISSSEEIAEMYFDSPDNRSNRKEIYTAVFLVCAAGAFYGFKIYKKKKMKSIS